MKLYSLGFFHGEVVNRSHVGSWFISISLSNLLIDYILNDRKSTGSHGSVIVRQLRAQKTMTTLSAKRINWRAEDLEKLRR